MLACELGLLGIRATVLEKLPSPTGLSKALGLQSRTMETLEDRGLLERFSAGRSAPPFSNFAMFQLDLHAIPFGHPYGIVIPQSEIEQLLEARARELGAEILRGHEITSVHQEQDLVTVGIRFDFDTHMKSLIRRAESQLLPANLTLFPPFLRIYSSAS